MICHKSKQKRSEVDALMRYCSFNEKEALLKWTEGMRIFRNSAGIEQESFLENCSLLLPPLPISQVPVITAQKSIDSRTLQTPIKIPRGTSSSSKRKSKRKACVYDDDGNEDYIDSVAKSRRKPKRLVFYPSSSDDEYCSIQP